MRPATSICALGLIGLMLASCASAPSYPEPQGSNGQILVDLKGEPKEGVTGPKRREVREDYSTRRESIEKGESFERVDYSDLPDVVVVVDGAPARAAAPSASELEINDDGFSRGQLIAVKAGASAQFTLRNARGSSVHLYGFNAADGSFESEVGAGSLGTVKVSNPGRYDVYCDEDESLHCILFVVESAAWIGDSEDGAFFNDLPPGEYEVTVYPPRLPEWSKKVKVVAGKRTTLTAELTVNNLPKVGK
ncbi:MAG: hypothetical protein KDB90_06645 [Planctomycetes bacterium]|nr:hypothetical protein [Planctomycetota bacterium]